MCVFEIKESLRNKPRFHVEKKHQFAWELYNGVWRAQLSHYVIYRYIVLKHRIGGVTRPLQGLAKLTCVVIKEQQGNINAVSPPLLAALYVIGRGFSTNCKLRAAWSLLTQYDTDRLRL